MYLLYSFGRTAMLLYLSLALLSFLATLIPLHLYSLTCTQAPPAPFLKTLLTEPSQTKVL